MDGKQTTFEAGMALMKNGLKLNEVLLVSVRKLDKSQRQKLSNDAKKRSTWRVSGHENQVDINSPVKSSISRFVDLVFGMSSTCQVASRICKTLEPLSKMQSVVEDSFVVRRTYEE